MKRTKLLKTQPCEAPRISSEEDVICASQIVEADGEKALEISLFYKGKLRGRYFADEENHNAWIDGKWYTLRLKNVIRVCMDASPLKNDYYYCTPSTKWAAPEDKERAYDFLDTYGIEDYEVRLGARKRQKAFERKLERIDQMMADVPYVPEDAETWMENEIFPENILFFKKGEKRITYSCTACGATSWRKKAWKHGEKTVCPKCGRPVTANCRQQERTRKEPIVILQQYGSGWIERQFRAICRWSYGEKKEIRLNEEIRAIIPEGQHWGKVWYGTMYNADEFEQEFWDKNGLNKHFLSSYLYPGDLPETLKRGSMEHSGMDLLAARREKFNVNKYITTFHQRPYLEYLAKAGLTRLAAEIVNTYGWWGEPSTIFQCGDTMVDVLQIDGNRVNRMKQINGGLHALEWLQYEEDMGVKISQESLEYLEKKKVGLDGCRPILQEVKSVNRMVNYMKKQKGEISKLCITWADYLRMAKAEGYDTTDDDTSGEESGEGDREETAGGQTAEPGGTESQGEEIAPAQKSPEILEKEAPDETERETDLGDEDGKTAEPETTEAAEAETKETEPGFEAMNAPEVIEKPFGSRKDWLDTLTAYGMAVEMAKMMKTMLTENLADMTETSFWEQWLNEEVDDHGQKIEEA